MSAEKRRTVRWPVWVLAGAAVTAIGVRQVEHWTASILRAGPMVQFPEPTTLVVAWEMYTQTERGLVRLRGPEGEREVEAIDRGGRYEVRFEDVRPGETYGYEVYDRGFLGWARHLSGPHETRTPPPRGRPFRFIAFGDSGSGSNTQRSLAELMHRQEPDLLIHVGDLVYPAGAAEDYLLKFYEPNAALIAESPFMPTLGNHDVATDKGRPFLDAFVLPENGPPGIEPERNYWFDYGDARFVALDTNNADLDKSGVITAEQMRTDVSRWVDGALCGCDAKWKFAYFHHPYYTGSEHAASGQQYVQDAFEDVFLRCGVQVVFWGHNHLYERTRPMRHDEIVDDDKGIVYVTTGAGGMSRYPENLPAPDYIRVYADQNFSFTVVEVSADRLTIRQIDEYGVLADEFTIE